MTIEKTRRSLEGLAANLFQRDHPARLWRGAAAAGATAEERALYRRFAGGMLRERRAPPPAVRMN